MALILPNSIFFHIPKCAGTWIRKAIKNSEIPTNEGCAIIPHDEFPTIIHNIIHSTPENFNTQGRFSFTFIRHPLTFYQSYWGFKMKQAKNNKPQSDEVWVKCGSDDFENFMWKLLEYRGGWVTQIYKTYALGKVDFIGKQENVVDDLIKALTLAGETFSEHKIRTTPRINTSSEWKDKCRYKPHLERAVLEADAEIVEMFY